MYYSQSEIAFCGKIKDNKRFFALVILSSHDNVAPVTDPASTVSSDNLNLALFDSSVTKSSTISSSCLVFRYLSSLNSKTSSVEFLLNEIAHVYRNQDCVFIGKNLESCGTATVATLGETAVFLGPANNVANNLNYELVSTTTQAWVMQIDQFKYMLFQCIKLRKKCIINSKF